MIQNEGSNLYAMLTWIYKAHAYRQLREIGRNGAWENLSKKNRESSYQLPLNLVTPPRLASLTPRPPTKARFYSLETLREYANR